MDNENIIQIIVTADLQTLFNLIEPIKDETEELQEAYKTIKNGKRIKYHIEWNLKGYHETRDRQQLVILKGNTYPIEEWWNEEEERRSTARKALLEYYGEEDRPYERR